MKDNSKLVIIKTVHTVIWILFVGLIFYIVYSGITGKITLLTWIAICIIVLEGLILAIFKLYCPLTILARKYSDSKLDNFDIYLPNWLAKNNKLIFTEIYLIGVILVLYRSSQL
ncbi:MAG: hypothetical protein IT280_08355 [Ignavibacteria bacterium]|nr:hypothetical protein [Ignavibacteria bacterium]